MSDLEKTDEEWYEWLLQLQRDAEHGIVKLETVITDEIVRQYDED